MKKYIGIVLLLSSIAYATGFVIESGETVTTQQVLSNVGDEGIIEAGGTIAISTSSTAAIAMENSNQVVSNAGVVTTTQTLSPAIQITGNTPTVVNTGSLITNGFVSQGIVNSTATGTAQFTNNGFISTGGILSSGMENDAGLSILINNGTISTEGLSASGIVSDGEAGSILINNGVITTQSSGSSALDNFNAGVTMINTGTISVNGTNSNGILDQSSTTNSYLYNSGSITTNGTNAFGMSSGESVDAVLINSGTITTLGNNSNAMVGGMGSYMQNTGTIITSNTDAIGMDVGEAGAILINAGTILTSGIGANAISISTDCQAINLGFILTQGGAADAVLCENGGSTITNLGTVMAIGSDSNGLNGGGNGTQIINGGTVYSKTGNAILMTGSNSSLNLLLGSNIQGTVNIEFPVSLGVEKGSNLLLTLTEGSAAFNSFSIDAPFVALADPTVAVIDSTGFGLQADMLADLSDTLLDDIYRHKWAFFNGCPCGVSVWAEGLGSWRERHNGIAYENWQGGFLAGVECRLFRRYFSAVGGASYGKASLSNDSQHTTLDSYFGGATYQQYFYKTFVGLAALAGYVHLDNKRVVMNNLVAGGTQTAKVDTGGYMVTAEASVARNLFTLASYGLRGSFTGRYAALFLGDYNETGSSANLSVYDRTVELLTARAEISFPCSNPYDRCSWTLEPYVGYAGRFLTKGSQVDTTLLGQALSFNPGSPARLGEMLVGLRANQAIRRLKLFLNVEGAFDSEHSNRVLGEGGATICF